MTEPAFGGRQARSYSLRLRLLAAMLGVVSLVWLLVAVAAWFEARHEAEEIFDAHLAQAALLLAAFTDDDIEELQDHLPGHRYGRKVIFQVWSQHGRLLAHTHNAPNSRLADNDRGFSDVSLQGRPWRVFSQWSENRHYLVQLAEAREARDEVARELAAHMLLPIIIALPALAFALVILIGRGLRPLSQLADDISRRQADRLDPIDLDDAPQELRPVVDRLNQLLHQVDCSLDQERRFTADAAHELRTPLAAIRTHAQVALEGGDATEQRHALECVIDATERATRLVEQLLTLARLDAAEWSRRFTDCDLRNIAMTVIADCAPAAIARHVEIGLDDGAAAPCRGDAALLAVLLRNLVENALRYSPPGAAVSVGLLPGPVLEVHDQGPGIPSEERNKVLERFHRVLGSPGDGAGLGLSIVARIAELHGASVEMADGPGGQGLRVSVKFTSSPGA